MKKNILVAAAIVCAAGSAQAQSPQEGDPSKVKAQAEQAARENLIKMAAEQAEAIERARQKVAEEANREAAERARQEQWKTAEVTPIDVEIVISRYEGDKRVGSLPYALAVNAVVAPGTDMAPVTRLRMGGQIPVPTIAPIVGPDGKPLGPAGGGPVQYRDVGTNIDCRARILDGGRFELWLSVEDSAVATAQGAGVDSAALPVIRTFRSANYLILRDGHTRQFTAAADRITGEIVRIDVTLRVVK